jgi:hypothetical protein
MVRNLGLITNFLVAAILLGVVVYLMWWQNNRLDAGAVSTLAGALFGGSVLLLGNGIIGINERVEAAELLSQRRAKLQTLITAELANLASDLLSVKMRVNNALETIRSNRGGTFARSHFSRNLPADLPLTMSFGTELLILDAKALDALATLHANLAMSRVGLSGDPNLQVGLLPLGTLAATLGHDMEILAECFEHIAPTRKLQLDHSPELASAILRRVAKTP